MTVSEIVIRPDMKLFAFDLLWDTNANSVCFPLTSEILAIGIINQALCRNDPQKLLSALLLPSGGLEQVQPVNARRYHDVLTKAKKCKAEVRNLHYTLDFKFANLY